ncbi:hypothetical protein [Gordonia hongkongensis]|uniref:hypothetical protein n=1 Tax=Gordonia hongkongensis TaxID=1701090 RepID=UPI003EC05AFB
MIVATGLSGALGSPNRSPATMRESTCADAATTASRASTARAFGASTLDLTIRRVLAHTGPVPLMRVRRAPIRREIAKRP